MKCCSALKKKNSYNMDEPKNIMLAEGSRSQRDRRCMVPPTEGV